MKPNYLNILLLLIFLSIGVKTYAQGGFKTRIYLPNAFDNTSRAIYEVSPGNYFAFGYVNDTLNGKYTNRLCVMGLNSTGQLQWVKKYGNDQFQYLDNKFVRRILYKQGNYIYYAGCVRENYTTQSGFLIKFKLNGDTVWQKVFRDAVEDVVPQMVTGSVDGGFLVTGFFQNWSNNTQPALLIKTDANGKELWRKRLHKTNCDVSDGKAILQDTLTKKIIIAGYQYLGCGNPYDNILVTDSLGNSPVFNNFLGDGGGAYDLIQTKDKKIVVCGLQFSYLTFAGSKLMKRYVAKFDVNNAGAPIWSQEYGGLTLGNVNHCIREMNNGDLLLGGGYDSAHWQNRPQTPQLSFSILDKNGAVKLSRYYNYKTNDTLSSNNMGLSSLELTGDGGWVAAIEVNNNPAPNPFFFVKYDGTGCDSSAAHCATLNSVGLNESVYKIESIGWKLWPNPSSDFFNLKVDNVFSSSISNRIVITNYLGEKLVDASIILNSETSTVDVQMLKSGCYFVEVLSNGRSMGKQKIILIK